MRIEIPDGFEVIHIDLKDVATGSMVTVCGGKGGWGVLDNRGSLAKLEDDVQAALDVIAEGGLDGGDDG